MPSKRRVLILCTHNSSRSQMAEGLLRAAAGGDIEVESAGTEATRVHPLAIAAMAERGIDITGHTSKTLDRFVDQPWDDVITVCDSAHETCPVFPKAGRRIHWSFEDPSKATGSEEAKLAVFRRIREEIDARFKAWLAEAR
ncbi:MAG: arsenate reductase ArsC [Candidatus Rokuibacteriota bacterium]